MFPLAVATALILLFLLGEGVAYGKSGDEPERTDIPYLALFTKYAALTNVPRRLMVAVVSHESGFNPRAVNRETAADVRLGHDVESLGLCQILFPDTARALYPGVSREECFDPERNIDMGFLVMRQQLDRYPAQGFPEDAVSAYNGGHSLRNGTTFRNQQYVDAVRAQWEKYSDV